VQVWVGLGNPGPQYALHRHNVGFMVVDTLAEVHGFGPVQKKFLGWVQEGRIGGQKILLLKPATFMNESGRSVGEALRFYKLGTEALPIRAELAHAVDYQTSSALWVSPPNPANVPEHRIDQRQYFRDFAPIKGRVGAVRCVFANCLTQ